MDEKGRFAVALAGVGGCLCLAAGIVFSGHGDAVAPSVDRPRSARVDVLPRWPMPSWADVAKAQAARPTTSAPRDLVMATVVKRPAPNETALESTLEPLTPQLQQPSRALTTHHLAIPMLVGTAPDVAGADVLVAQARTRSRGAMTGALVTAGTYVGGSFKTIGRTLRRVF